MSPGDLAAVMRKFLRWAWPITPPKTSLQGSLRFNDCQGLGLPLHWIHNTYPYGAGQRPHRTINLLLLFIYLPRSRASRARQKCVNASPDNTGTSKFTTGT